MWRVPHISKDRPQVFLEKGFLKICSKFTGNNFIKITLQHGCSPVNLLHIFGTPFLRTPLGGCFKFLSTHFYRKWVKHIYAIISEWWSIYSLFGQKQCLSSLESITACFCRSWICFAMLFKMIRTITGLLIQFFICLAWDSCFRFSIFTFVTLAFSICFYLILKFFCSVQVLSVLRVLVYELISLFLHYLVCLYLHQELFFH